MKKRLVKIIVIVQYLHFKLIAIWGKRALLCARASRSWDGCKVRDDGFCF